MHQQPAPQGCETENCFLEWKVSTSDVHPAPLPTQSFWRFASTGSWSACFFCRLARRACFRLLRVFNVPRPGVGKTDRPLKPPTSLLRHLLAFTGTTTGTRPTNQPHQAPNPHGQSRPPQYHPFRTPSLRATFLRRPLAPPARAARSRRPRSRCPLTPQPAFTGTRPSWPISTYPIPPLPHTGTSRHPLAPPARAARSRRPLAPPAFAARSRRPLAPPSRATHNLTARSRRPPTPPAHRQSA